MKGWRKSKEKCLSIFMRQFYIQMFLHSWRLSLSMNWRNRVYGLNSFMGFGIPIQDSKAFICSLVHRKKIINQFAQICRHTIYWGMREAPYLVLKMLSKRATKVVSRPGTWALVCKALQARKTISIQEKPWNKNWARNWSKEGYLRMTGRGKRSRNSLAEASFWTPGKKKKTQMAFVQKSRWNWNTSDRK